MWSRACAAGTEFSNVRFKGDDGRAAKVYENVQPVTPQDIADTVLWLYQRPKHVNVNAIEIMPTAQASARCRCGGRRNSPLRFRYRAGRLKARVFRRPDGGRLARTAFLSARPVWRVESAKLFANG